MFLSDYSLKENEILYGVVVERHCWFVEFSTLFWLNEHIGPFSFGYEPFLLCKTVIRFLSDAFSH